MTRVLLVTATTGYQTRAFGDAAARLGVELVFATDRCHVLDDPWQDHAIAIRFHDEDAALRAILDAARSRPIDGVLAVGDRPTVIGARAAAALGLPGHPPEAVAVARNKRLMRERMRDRGLPSPWFIEFALDDDWAAHAPRVRYPCVAKPLALSGSRGVMRADDEAGLAAAVDRLRRLLNAPDIRSERSPAHDGAILEEFIDGTEFALEGIMNDGVLHTLALFDKPDPLDGPFFEETLYVTPSVHSGAVQRAVEEAVVAAVRALGLHHGPIHAECRVGDRGAIVLEVAARPIGGLCARALRFTNPSEEVCTLEELLLRHALGESSAPWRRETAASGVMMIPIPHRGIYRRVSGLDEARHVPDVCEIRITAKPDQLLVPLPEGASYLGFIFARAARAAEVERALRDAHARLQFVVDPEVRMVESPHV
jgi:biotin carboxylase